MTAPCQLRSAGRENHNLHSKVTGLISRVPASSPSRQARSVGSPPRRVGHRSITGGNDQRAAAEPRRSDVSRMCPATDCKKMLKGGHCWSANVLVQSSPRPIRHAPESACIRLLIRRFWVRVPPPEPPSATNRHGPEDRLSPRREQAAGTYGERPTARPEVTASRTPATGTVDLAACRQVGLVLPLATARPPRSSISRGQTVDARQRRQTCNGSRSAGRDRCTETES